MGAILLLSPKQRKINVGARPRPSGEVRAKCDDPNCSLVEAVKAYRDQTGLGLSEAKAAVESYRASKHHFEETDNVTSASRATESSPRAES